MRQQHSPCTTGLSATSMADVDGCAGFDFVIDWNGNGNAFSAHFDSPALAPSVNHMIGLRFSAEHIFGYANICRTSLDPPAVMHVQRHHKKPHKHV